MTTFARDYVNRLSRRSSSAWPGLFQVLAQIKYVREITIRATLWALELDNWRSVKLKLPEREQVLLRVVRPVEPCRGMFFYG